MSAHDEAFMEPVPVQLIPVSGVADVTLLPAGQFCITLYQDVPNADGVVERVVMVRLLWATEAAKVANHRISELLAEQRTGPAMALRLAH